MQQDSLARIVLGGKLTGIFGYTACIAEDIMVALHKQQPVFVIAGFGGAAHVIADILEGKATSETLKSLAQSDTKYLELYQWCENNDHHIDYEHFDKYNWKDLNNGLSEEQNRILFHSVDIVEIVSLVLLGLSNIVSSFNHE